MFLLQKFKVLFKADFFLNLFLSLKNFTSKIDPDYAANSNQL